MSLSDIVVQCEGVSKKFSKSLKKSMLYGGLDIMGSTFGVMPDSGRLRPGEFWSLDDISFELKRGESFGIMGPNGSGKTTLLKMLNGIFMPDKGRITVKGKMGALIQVGAGFHPMLSGRENIYINGAILGMKKREIDEKFDSIVDFADIGDFLDSPVKFYSSGMYVRLGFAIAVHCRPDILLIDEVLAVGDIKFHYKCLQFITNNILKNGCTVVFVSHDRYAIESICQKAVYLKKGKMMKIGSTLETIGQYLDDVKSEENSLGKKVDAHFDAEGITRVVFLDKENRPQKQFKSGDAVKIRFYYSFKEMIPNPSIGITFRHNDPRFTIVSSTDYLFSLHSGYDGLEVSQLRDQGYFEVSIDCLYIPVGVYTCVTCLYTENRMNLVRLYEEAGALEVLWTDTKPQRSLIDLPHRWTRTQEATI